MDKIETPRRTTAAGGKQLRRQRSRLQMHAPSSIEVAHPPVAAAAAEWSIVIPLLSPIPLGILAIGQAAEAPLPVMEEDCPPTDNTEDKQQQQVGGARWQTWRHPAMPFCYEPAPGSSGPAFLLPHYA
ncbi:hypothetical protein Cni_G14549 [Canna indica]|uniref:Uncharacterized protein n=1 Tax=Canna indica TaxID=4628 RepID=A0AAQ3QE33_9LILI|nr:hypothetical protein Cni_G14549 [Canna indica]